MAAYGWTVAQVDDLPFVTAKALAEQVRSCPPQNALPILVAEAEEAQAEAGRESAMRKMGAEVAPRTQRKILRIEVKKTGKRVA